ncbi:MAG: methyltransferase domain-containing protein [Gammaproteobacteria bacterium]|nr:methyltransferase domain-containing protein [Gammaproteobacteria bacterium]
MHASSYENMQKCYDRYLKRSPIYAREQIVVLDVGSADINGSYREIFSYPKIRYWGLDLTEGASVDLVLRSPYEIPVADGFADVVICGQMFEHCEYFWLVFQEMLRVLKAEGFLFLIAPSSGPIHQYPVDCYRFYPDSYKALAKLNNCYLVDSWLDDRGPWKDLVGIFSKEKKEKWTDTTEIGKSEGDHSTSSNGNSQACASLNYNNDPEVNVMSGSCSYLELLRIIHEELAPEFYVEIGVKNGASLRLGKCSAIGIDPAPELSSELPDNVKVFRRTSDDFFEFDAPQVITRKIDLTFIDGMHRFEYALRDFLNVERFSSSGSLIVVDDIFPNDAIQAKRVRESRVWTGDIWKLLDCLATCRGDLILIPVNTLPAGSLLVASLDPANRVLTERYNYIVSEFLKGDSDGPPRRILDRNNALEPEDARIISLLHILRDCRKRGLGDQVIRERLEPFSKEFTISDEPAR